MPLSPAFQTKLTQLKYDHAALAFEFARIKLELAYDRAGRAEARLHPTTHYIWRTRGDNKVRASHAANTGKVFAWDNPPPTGHPGEDYGCRCWAQPVLVNAGKPVIYETLEQPVTSIVDEGLSRWEWYDFVIHFYFGGGKPVQLSHIGHLQDVIDRANEHKLRNHQVHEGVEFQVIKKARAILAGTISDTFAGTYDFSPVSFVHRISTVQGNFSGEVQKDGEFLIISAHVNYEFSDSFTDPLDIIQLITGTPREIGAFIIKLALVRNISVEALKQLYKASAKRSPDDIYDWIKWIAEFGGTKYPITGNWKTAMHAVVLKDQANSKFWDEDGGI